MYYVNERWLGGMLTNFKTIQGRIARLKRSRLCLRTVLHDVLPKKEVIELKKEWDKLEESGWYQGYEETSRCNFHRRS